jgi:hypothetical protein
MEQHVNPMWPEILDWCLRQEIAPDPEIDVFVCNNSGRVYPLEQQLQKAGQPFVTLGAGQEYRRNWHNMYKLQLYLDAALASTKPYVCGLDCFDICLSGGLAGLKGGLGGKQMLVAQDAMHWPTYAPHPELCINAGAWIATRRYAVEFFAKAAAAVDGIRQQIPPAFATARYYKDEQQVFYYCWDAEAMRIDDACSFMQVILCPERVVDDWVEAARVINLAQRTDKWRHVQGQLKNWPFVAPERFEGIVVPGQHGLWGCRESHCGVLREAMAKKLPHVFILEDDFILAPDFCRRAASFLNAVPDDWDMLMLGGCHHRPPRPSGVPGIVRGTGVDFLHGYIVRDAAMPKLLDLWQTMRRHKHIDNYLVEREMLGLAVYCPEQFIIGQAGGFNSDITGLFRARSQFWSKEQDQVRRNPVRLQHVNGAKVVSVFAHDRAAELAQPRQGAGCC